MTDRANEQWCPPSRLGPWRNGKTLGSGGQGAVCRYQHESSEERTGALKVCREDDGALEHERRVVSRLRDIRGVVQPESSDFAVHEDEGLLWIALSWVDGEQLHSWAEQASVATRDVLLALYHAAQAISAIHARGVAHLDLCSENLLRTPDGGVTLVDFGIAFDRANPRSHPWRYWHRKSSVPPEVRRLLKCDQGATLTLEGARRWDAYAFGKLIESLVSPIEARDGVPPALVDLITHLTKPDPEDRLERFEDVADRLRQMFLANEPVGASLAPNDARGAAGVAMARGDAEAPSLGSPAVARQPVASQVRDPPAESARDAGPPAARTAPALWVVGAVGIVAAVLWLLSVPAGPVLDAHPGVDAAKSTEASDGGAAGSEQVAAGEGKEVVPAGEHDLVVSNGERDELASSGGDGPSDGRPPVATASVRTSAAPGGGRHESAGIAPEETPPKPAPHPRPVRTEVSSGQPTAEGAAARPTPPVAIRIEEPPAAAKPPMGTSATSRAAPAPVAAAPVEPEDEAGAPAPELDVGGGLPTTGAELERLATAGSRADLQKVVDHVASNPDWLAAFPTSSVRTLVASSITRHDRVLFPPAGAQKAVGRVLPTLGPDLSCREAKLWLAWTYGRRAVDSTSGSFYATYCPRCQALKPDLELGSADCYRRRGDGYRFQNGRCVHVDNQLYAPGCR